VQRARDHLHIVLATSPVGDAFRRRCRHFPSLINCMGIDYYAPWPAEALLGVGVRVLEELGLEQAAGAGIGGGACDAAAAATAPSLVSRVAQLCVQVHQDVEAAAERFHSELRRR
jgi:dynein heavy chain